MSYKHFVVMAVSSKLLLQDYLTQNCTDLLNGLQVIRNIGVIVKEINKKIKKGIVKTNKTSDYFLCALFFFIVIAFNYNKVKNKTWPTDQLKFGSYCQRDQ